MVLPPTTGTHPGMLHDSRPTVLFHSRATALNAIRNGAVMAPATDLKAEPIHPGIFFRNSHVLAAAFLIHAHDARQARWNQSVLVAMTTMMAMSAAMARMIHVVGLASCAAFQAHCAAVTRP